MQFKNFAINKSHNLLNQKHRAKQQKATIRQVEANE